MSYRFADSSVARNDCRLVSIHKFLVIKPTRCTNFSNLFLEWNSTHFGQFLCPSSGVLHCTHNNGICHTGLLTACVQQAVSKPVWHIPLLCVQWRTPDDGQRNCPKCVEFHSKNKFEKLLHLVGFIKRNVCMDTNLQSLCYLLLTTFLHFLLYSMIFIVFHLYGLFKWSKEHCRIIPPRLLYSLLTKSIPFFLHRLRFDGGSNAPFEVGMWIFFFVSCYMGTVHVFKNVVDKFNTI
jgi:hypothetical protein